MTDNREELMAQAERVRRWRSLGEEPSDGTTLCAGCWDRSNYNVHADNNIPKGQPVFWNAPHPEYGDCDAYCAQCVEGDIAAIEATDWRALAETGR
jgi:hypothetical protein